MICTTGKGLERVRPKTGAIGGSSRTLPVGGESRRKPTALRSLRRNRG
jgi:hypothetical protein